MKNLFTILFILALAVPASCATLKWQEACPPDGTYRVKGYDTGGARSDPSNEVLVTESCIPATGYDVEKSVIGDWSDTEVTDVGNATTYDTVKGLSLSVQ